MNNTKTIKSQENIFIATPCAGESNCIELFVKHKNIELTIYAYIITGTEANQILQQQSLAISSEDKAHQRVIIQPTHFELGMFDKNKGKGSISADDMYLTIGMMLTFSYAYWQHWLTHNNKTEVYFLPRATLVNAGIANQEADIKKAMQGIGATMSESMVNAWNKFNDDKSVVNEFVDLHLRKHSFSPADGIFSER